MAKKKFKLNVFGLFKLEVEGWKPWDILLTLLLVMFFLVIVQILVKYIISTSFLPGHFIYHQ